MTITMNLRSLYAIAIMLAFCDLCELGFCSDDELILNGIEDIEETFETPLHVESLARFAVQEHNKQQNSKLEFSRVLKAKQQVVAGKLYYLTLETIDAGKKKTYEAQVWVKPWMNFQQLEEFKLAPSKLGN